MSAGLRLKRHETFSIREGWLEKGLNIVNEFPTCFTKDNGPIYFGIGSNMCKSLKYWLEATGVAFFGQKGAFLTDFGKFLLNKDKYLEDETSWWLVHVSLVTNKNDSPVFYEFFNSKLMKFDKDMLFNYLQNVFKNEYGEIVNSSSLDADVSMLIKTYFAEECEDPENNMNCPLSKLGLLDSIGNKMFSRSIDSYCKLDYRVVYYSIIKCLDQCSGEISFNIEDLCERKNNPLKVFNLNKSTLFAYLEEMKKRNLIVLIKTAGLNIVRIERIKSLDELFIEGNGNV